MEQETKKCPECGSSDVSRHAFGTPDSPRWEIVCNNCGCVIAED